MENPSRLALARSSRYGRLTAMGKQGGFRIKEPELSRGPSKDLPRCAGWRAVPGRTPADAHTCFHRAPLAIESDIDTACVHKRRDRSPVCGRWPTRRPYVGRGIASDLIRASTSAGRINPDTRPSPAPRERTECLSCLSAANYKDPAVQSEQIPGPACSCSTTVANYS